jgi:hypothetical protein
VKNQNNVVGGGNSISLFFRMIAVEINQNNVVGGGNSISLFC